MTQKSLRNQSPKNRSLLKVSPVVRSQKDKIRPWYPFSKNTRSLEKSGHTPNLQGAKDHIFKWQVLYVKNNTEYFHSRRNSKTKNNLFVNPLKARSKERTLFSVVCTRKALILRITCK